MKLKTILESIHDVSFHIDSKYDLTELNNGDYYSVRMRYKGKTAHSAYKTFVIFEPDEKNNNYHFVFNMNSMGLLFHDTKAGNIYSALKPMGEVQDLLNKDSQFYIKLYKESKESFLRALEKLMKQKTIKYLHV